MEQKQDTKIFDVYSIDTVPLKFRISIGYVAVKYL